MENRKFVPKKPKPNTPLFHEGRFQTDDLLFRRPLSLLREQTRSFYTDKTILVTGGGGSVGRELSRQIAACRPARLILFDIYENNAYLLACELLQQYPTLDLALEIGSVRDRERLESLFSYYRPQVVFHAAAHKHVPLMEHNAQEAIKNNVFGTKNTADMAEKYGALKFILISTDKAVHPVGVMGASKRVCEMIVQSRSDAATRFAAVRFGNVLGSDGSVTSLFKRQIETGGPVTITDKRMQRFFMTLSEAAQLLMEAGAMAQGGELFVLRMTEPVSLYELAKRMIRLAGRTPETDIAIEEIGLRPGEKLREELFLPTRTQKPTEHKQILIEEDTPLTRREIEDKLSILTDAVTTVQNGSVPNAVHNALKQILPHFAPDSESKKPL